MSNPFDHFTEQYQNEGARLHASWNADLFQSLCTGPVASVWKSLGPEAKGLEQSKKLLEGYLHLLQEAVGQGYIQNSTGGPWSNMMELVLVKFLPEQLASIKPSQRHSELAKIWNLLEGLLGEPAWINQLVLARALELKQVTQLEQFLVDVLDPVLSPAPTAKFSGPFRQVVLDTKSLDEDFLPGEMTLAAPWVLCIHDRRRPVRLGVLLQKEGRSEFIGLLPELEPYHDSAPLPRVKAENSALYIGEQKVELPRLNVPYRVAIARAGFVVASALDSQRLWVVESA